MIAVLTNDGDGYESIIAILSSEEYLEEYIKSTGFIFKGYQESPKTYDDYWCISFDKNKEGILVNTNEDEDYDDEEEND